MSTQLKRKYIVICTGVSIAIAAAAYSHWGSESLFSKAVASNAAPVTEIDAATVIAQTITDYQSYSGRLEAIDQVEIRPLVSGTIVAVHFKDGALVKKGDPLFTIDPRPYAAVLDHAIAELIAAQARNGYAATDSARAERLLGENAISKRDYDLAQNAAREALANVKAAEAAIETAKINLGYTNIVAPVSGRVSRAELTVGNIVSVGAGAPLLTTLVSVSPLYASFDVDEQTYLAYLSHDSKKSVPVYLGLANEAGYSRQGAIDSVDNRLDTNSGTIRVRARFSNDDGSLMPGLYARVKVGGGFPHNAILISDAAVGTDQDKKFVMVVDNTDKVQYREIVPGNEHDGLRVVTKGLNPGERIVVSGLQRVRPNDTVKANMVQMAPANDASSTGS